MSAKSRFTQLTSAHLPAAYNLAYWMLRERADAEDAVQDAYLRAFRAFGQWRGGDIKPWLLTIVRNVCYRHLQERRRSGNVISLDEALGPLAEPAVVEAVVSRDRSPEQSLIAASDQAVLTSAIAALAPVFREVIVLREIEELTYEEIADIIGAPIGTVMSRLSRARADLRTLMTNLMDRNDSNAM